MLIEDAKVKELVYSEISLMSENKEELMTIYDYMERFKTLT